MPATKQIYTANNIWTAAQLASLFRSAFIDAGLMTEWYDSFLSGAVENRILEIVYDSGKTYGKCYYWFMFTTTTVAYQYASGWNATTHVPTGTALLDYVTTTTNSVSNTDTLRTTLSTSLPVQVIRYTSGVSSSFSVFMVGQSNSFAQFMISPQSHAPYSWIDLNKNLFHSLVRPRFVTTNLAANLTFTSTSLLRRSFCIGSALKGSASNSSVYWLSSLGVSSYSVIGRGSNTTNNFGYGSGVETSGNPRAMSVFLPAVDGTANTAYSANYNPVCYGMPYSMYIPNSQLPSDLGIISHYANNTMQSQDTFVVSTGVEEWEIIGVVNASVADGTSASIALAARMI